MSTENASMVTDGLIKLAEMFDSNVEFFERILKIEYPLEKFNGVNVSFAETFCGTIAENQIIVSLETSLTEFLISKKDGKFTVFNLSEETKLWKENEGILKFDIVDIEQFAQIMDRLQTHVTV